MKIKYYKPKNARIKKGTTKMEYGSKKRKYNFFGLTMIDGNNSWWCEDLNKWCKLEEVKGKEFSNYNNDIKSLKAAISHIKRHPELKKGIIMNLSGNFRYYDIDIII
jgi:hypothetical protein